MVSKKKVSQNAEEKGQEVQVVKLVKMIKADGKTADVHPLEVENYSNAGYVEVS